MENTGGNGESRVRVLLADDEVSVREMLATSLHSEGVFTVAGEASSGLEALELFRNHRPELIVLALPLPGVAGPEVLRMIRAEQPETRFLVYCGTRNPALLRAGLESRPHGFVHKTEPFETLRIALRAVAAGGSFFGPFATRLDQREDGEERFDKTLTPKQRIVLQMIAEGKSTRETAALLNLSPKTIEHYRAQIMRRMGVRDVASLTRHALRLGLVQ